MKKQFLSLGLVFALAISSISANNKTEKNLFESKLLAATITIYDGGGVLNIVYGINFTSIEKKGIIISSFGNKLTITTGNGQVFNIDYENISVPVSANIEELKIILAGFVSNQTGGSEGLTNTELRASPVPVSGSFSLPAGISTAARQDTIIKYQTNGLQKTQITTSILPTGGSTSALQTSGNSSLTTIATNSATQATAANQTSANSTLTTIAGKDFATQTTLSSLNSKDFATATLQGTGNTSLSSIDGKFTTLNAKDFATQTTLASVLTKLNSSIAVTGTFYQATQPVSGTFWQATQPVSGTVTITPSGTQTITGTVTANAGTNLNTSALSLDATQTNGNQKTQIVDGSGNVSGAFQTISGTNYIPVVLASSVPPNSAVPVRNIAIAGSDGTNAQTISVDATGKININNISGTISIPAGAATSANQTTANTSLSTIATNSGTQATAANQTNGTQQTQIVSSKAVTYSASITGLAMVTGATDFFTITGSGTKTIKVTAIHMNGLRTASGTSAVLLIKRSSANSAGTSTNPTAIPYDSNDGAATATITAYTANPTLGTAVGTVRSQKIFMSASATLYNDRINYIFDNTLAKPIILRGTSQVLALNYNAIAILGADIDIYIEWTEE